MQKYGQRSAGARGVHRQKSGHFSAIPQRGHLVVLVIPGTHDGVVSPSAMLPAGSRRSESSMRAFLCSDLANGITGEILYVDGGFSTVGMSFPQEAGEG